MPNTISRYGLNWPWSVNPLEMEFDMVRNGGRWKMRNGQMAGLGMFHHFKQALHVLWPEIIFHDWVDRQIRCYLDYRIIGQIGPASCVAGSTRIRNPISGDDPTIRELYKEKVNPTVMTLGGPASADVPFIKGEADLYEVTTAHSQFIATSKHLVLSEHGFCHVESLRIGQSLVSYTQGQLQSTSEHDQSIHGEDDLRYSETPQGSQFDYQTYLGSCGEQPLQAEGIYQALSPFVADALQHNACRLPASSHVDDLDSRLKHSRPYLLADRLSTSRTSDPSSLLGMYGFRRDPSEMPVCASDWFQRPVQSVLRNIPLGSFSESTHRAWRRHPTSSVFQLLPSAKYKVQLSEVQSIKHVGRDLFYDLTVPEHHHYFAEGAIHHNTGKTFVPSACCLLDYYCYPDCTTVLVSSTTRESLEMRVLGEVKKLHKLARERYSWIPGNLIEGKQRIVTDDRSIAAEGRDFRNGLVGIAVKRGQNYQGIEEYVGIKNKRIRCLFDEAQFLPRVFVDSIANLNKNPDLKCVVSGNPKDVTDALGIVCEPAAQLGGWDGGIDQSGGTKEWETRYNRGVCLQLVGTDSPNLDGKLGIPLITQEQIDTDIRFYGEDSLQFSMMDLGRMPRGQSNRRVITRQMCLKFHAMEEPVWKDDNRTRVGFLDPAYSGMGGDRTVFGEVQFGSESTPTDSQPSISAIVTQKLTDRSNPQILAIIDTMVVPVTDKDELPEDQIALFVKAECERRGIAPENFFFDSTGRGSLMGAFARLWSPQVQGIEFGGKPSERKVSADMDVEASRYYSNLVTELWMNSRYLIEAGQCRGMTEDLMMEGCMREWGYVGLGAGSRIKIEKKDDMKKRAGRSPDLFDAFVCGVEGARRRGFVIKRQVAVAHKRVDNTWKKELRERAANLARSGVLDHAV